MTALMPLFEASLRGALLIGFLALLRTPLRRLIGSPWLCALWLLVLVRLLLPGSIQSSWSAFNWWPETKAVQGDPDPIEARVTILSTAGLAASPALTAPAVNTIAREPARNGRWLVFVWAIGAAATMTILGRRILKTARMARSTQLANDARLLEAFDSIAPELRRNVELRQVTGLEVPALVGLWRPQVWMPISWLEKMSVEELRHVLLHELGHARRGDLWVQWLFAFAECVHWFNPMVWLAARLAHADRELACDAWVLRRANLHEPQQYGATLVKAAQLLRSRWHLPPAAITMAVSKAGLFSRVRTIGQFQPIAGWRAALGSVGVGVLLGSLATDRLHAQSGGLAPSAAPGAAPAPAPGGPPLTTTFPATGAAPYGGVVAGHFGIAPAPVQAAPATMSPYVAGTAGMPVPAQYQVEVQARFIEMPEAGWKTLGLSGFSADGMFEMNSVLDPSALHTLLARINETGTEVALISAPRVTTKSGQRAAIEITREFRYGVAFTPDQNYPDGLLPTSFETRNVGVTLEVEPAVSPDGASVDLQLVPQIVELTGFVRVRDGQPVPLAPDATKSGIERLTNVSLPKDVVVQPIFSTKKIATAVRLDSGNTIVLGGLKHAGGSQTGEEARVLFVLITARVLPHAGATLTPVPPAPGLTPAPGGFGDFQPGGGFPPTPVVPVPAGPPGGIPGPQGAGGTVMPGAPPSLPFAPGLPGSSPRPAARMPAPAVPPSPGAAPAPVAPPSLGR
jgi:bla regulator protein BlaR1